MLPAVQLTEHKAGYIGTTPAPVTDADFILYVIADAASCSSASTIAWAAYLDQDPVDRRPIAGITNVCKPGYDFLASAASQQSIVDVMTHEILHALARVAAAAACPSFVRCCIHFHCACAVSVIDGSAKRSHASSPGLPAGL
jgi:hypothetical protein